MVRESQSPRSTIHAKNGDVVRTLIAHIKQLACWIEIETARIISPGPFFTLKLELASLANGENSHAVMQTVACINEPPVTGNQNLGAEVTAGEPARQTGGCLSRGQLPVYGIVVEQNNVRTLLLEGIKPAA